MLSQSQHLRKRYFDDYSSQARSLAKFEPKFAVFGEGFICPFCQFLFRREAIHSGELSVEHCIPAAVGGTLRTSTLVCAKCNNNMGSSMDSHLKHMLDSNNLLNGRSQSGGKCWVAFDGNRVRAELRTAPGEPGSAPRMTFVFDKDRSNPDQYRSALEYLHKTHQPDEFRFQFDFSMGYSVRKQRLAMLRIAYLMMFRQFGYTYCFNRAADIVRDQFANPNSIIIPEIATVTVPQQPPRTNCVGVARHRSGSKSFLVLVELSSDGHRTFHAIPMPGLNADGGEFFHELYEQKRRAEAYFADIDFFGYDPCYISEPSAALHVLDVWRGTDR